MWILEYFISFAKQLDINCKTRQFRMIIAFNPLVYCQNVMLMMGCCDDVTCQRTSFGPFNFKLIHFAVFFPSSHHIYEYNSTTFWVTAYAHRKHTCRLCEFTNKHDLWLRSALNVQIKNENMNWQKPTVRNTIIKNITWKPIWFEHIGIMITIRIDIGITLNETGICQCSQTHRF